MSKIFSSNIKDKILLDCTLRDEGYYYYWDFDSDLVKEYLNVMSKIGINVVEIEFTDSISEFMKLI